MSNPIINPLWIYLIHVLSNLGNLAIGIAIFSGAILLIGCIFYFIWIGDSYSPSYEDDIEANKLYQRILKRVAIIFSVASLLIVVIPSEKIMYTMIVSNYITQENIELTCDAIEDMVDYTFEKVDELGEDN